jgi:biotin carboxyl carrier protein
MKYAVSVDGQVFEIEIGSRGRIWVDQEPHQVDLRHVGASGEYSLLVDNRSYEIHVADRDDGRRWVMVGGRPYHTRVQLGHGGRNQGRAGAGNQDCAPREGPTSHVEMRAPLPGLLVGLSVREGEHVREQQLVAVLESMKMNLELRAPRDGVIRDLLAVRGQQVAQGELLVVLRLNEASPLRIK